MTTVLAAIVSGVLVLLAGNIPWAGFGRLANLSARNLRVGTAVPWAVVVPARAGPAECARVNTGPIIAAIRSSQERDL